MNFSATVAEWASLRKAVGAALFITYFVYYAVYYFATFRQQQRPKLYLQISTLGSKLYLYGVGCLLSLNYMQASVHQAAFAYFNMLAIFGIIFTMLFQFVPQKIRQMTHIVFYGLLLIWYMGIVIDYYQVLST